MMWNVIKDDFYNNFHFLSKQIITLNDIVLSLAQSQQVQLTMSRVLVLKRESIEDTQDVIATRHKWRHKIVCFHHIDYLFLE